MYDVSFMDGISSHAPREGNDPVPQRFNQYFTHFNPHSPRGERLQKYTK